MQDNIDKYVLEGFNTYFSRLFDNVEKIESSGPKSIIVTGDGGMKVEYHDGLHSIKWLRAKEEIGKSEEMWRREFKYKLNKKMSDANMHLTMLSDISGVSLATLYNYLNLKTTPNCWAVYKIAQALKCDPSDLI